MTDKGVETGTGCILGVITTVTCLCLRILIVYQLAPSNKSPSKAHSMSPGEEIFVSFLRNTNVHYRNNKSSQLGLMSADNAYILFL